MNADHFFSIGDTHEVCQDFALSGVRGDNLSYAIICDGCSSSEAVDFGARALAYAARDLIVNQTPLFLTGDAKAVGRVIVDKASIIGTLTVPPRCLDATLLAICAQKLSDSFFRVRVLMYGDGVFIRRSPLDGSVNTYHVEYQTVPPLPSGAPFYLSYLLNSERLESYRESCNAPKILTQNINGVVQKTEVAFDEPMSFDYPHLSATDQLMVTSDGIGSFKNAVAESLSYTQFVDLFSVYKNTNGTYLQRRMKAMKRQLVVDKWVHDDDISAAAIIL